MGTNKTCIVDWNDILEGAERARQGTDAPKRYYPGVDGTGAAVVVPMLLFTLGALLMGSASVATILWAVTVFVYMVVIWEYTDTKLGTPDYTGQQLQSGISYAIEKSQHNQTDNTTECQVSAVADSSLLCNCTTDQLIEALCSKTYWQDWELYHAFYVCGEASSAEIDKFDRPQDIRLIIRRPDEQLAQAKQYAQEEGLL